MHFGLAPPVLVCAHTVVATQERCLAVFFMVMGCAFFAWITGRITALLTSNSSCVTKFETTLDELNEYMEARDFPIALKDRLRSFYMLKFPTKMIFDEVSILDSLEAGLRKECYLHLYSDIVSNVVLFSLCDSHTQKEICYRLHSTYRAAGSELITAGKPGEAVYLVRFGVVEVFVAHQLLKTCYSGDLVGENALLGLTPDGKRSISATTKTMSELCVLYTDDFNQLLLECPSFRATVARACEMHIGFLERCADLDQQLHLRDWVCVDWSRIESELREERANDKKRDHHRLGSMATMKDVCKGERRPLRTLVKLTLRDMYLESLLKSHRDKTGQTVLPLCPSTSSPRSGVKRDSLYVTVQWQGDPLYSNKAGASKSAVQCESPLVLVARTAEEALARGRLEIMHTIDLMLVHNEANWQDLPPLIITVHRCPEDLQVSAGTLTHRRAFRKVDLIKQEIIDATTNGGTTESGFKEHNQDEILYSTSVSLTQILEHRFAADKGGLCLTLNHSTGTGKLAEVGPLALNLTCRVTRRLWPGSRWFTVLQTLRNNHSSQFFKNKRRAFVKAVRRHSKQFFSSVDEKALRLTTVQGWASALQFKGDQGEQSDRQYQNSESKSQSEKARNQEFQTVMEKMDTLLEEMNSTFSFVRRETEDLRKRQEHYEEAIQDCCSLIRSMTRQDAVSSERQHSALRGARAQTRLDDTFSSPDRSKRVAEHRAITSAAATPASSSRMSARIQLQSDRSVKLEDSPSSFVRRQSTPIGADLERARPQLASELGKSVATARPLLPTPLRSALSAALEAREASASAGARTGRSHRGELDSHEIQYSKRENRY